MGERHGERGQASRGRNSVLARVKCLLLTMFGVLASDCALPALVPLLRNRTTAARWAAHDLVVASTVLSTVYKTVPTEVSPLTRQRRGDPRMAGRWDVVALEAELEAELGAVCSELVDPSRSGDGSPLTRCCRPTATRR
jgi:hypothetical protein